MDPHDRDVRFVPKADITQLQQLMPGSGQVLSNFRQ
jgi:hypothetical protein